MSDTGYVRLPSGVRPPLMTPEFKRLADYNAEKHRGIIHTPEHVEEMRLLQNKWNEWWKPYVDEDGWATVRLDSRSWWTRLKSLVRSRFGG